MRPTRYIVGILAIAATLATTNPLTGQDLPTVGILDFTGFMLTDPASSESLGKAVSAMLITEMSGREGIRVIERQDLRRLLEEQALAVSGMVDDNTAIEIGRLLGAQYMVFGSATISGEMRLDMRAVDVETSEILEAQKLVGPPEDLLDILMRASDRFAERLSLAPPSERAAMQEIPIRATIEFSRGVDFEDKGDTEQAIARYEAALVLHPTHRDAQRALDRLRNGGGE